jgi:hypothetical protein
LNLQAGANTRHETECDWLISGSGPGKELIGWMHGRNGEFPKKNTLNQKVKFYAKKKIRI